MEVVSIAHKALRRFYLTGNAKGLVGDVERIRRMLSFIVAAEAFEELKLPPNFGLHELTGDRSGHWAMTVTKNWRMTFAKVDETTIADLDLEDYH
jgi:proteic killer suppression protein